MAKNHTVAGNARRIWRINLAPLVVATQAGVAHAARTASRERHRARSRARFQAGQWRPRWLLVAGATFAAAGVAGAGFAALARRRGSEQPDLLETSAEHNGDSPTKTLRSNMETSRERVAGATLAMMGRMRRTGAAPTTAGATNPNERVEPHPASASPPPL